MTFTIDFFYLLRCPSDEDLSGSALHATITNFDKRRLDTKFYVSSCES